MRKRSRHLRVDINFANELERGRHNVSELMGKEIKMPEFTRMASVTYPRVILIKGRKPLTIDW